MGLPISPPILLSPIPCTPHSLIFLASAGSCDQTKTNHLKYQQKKEHLLLTTLHPCSLIFLASAGSCDQTIADKVPAKERKLASCYSPPPLPNIPRLSGQLRPDQNKPP